MSYFMKQKNNKIDEVENAIKKAFGRNLNVKELQTTYKDLKEKYEKVKQIVDSGKEDEVTIIPINSLILDKPGRRGISIHT